MASGRPKSPGFIPTGARPRSRGPGPGRSGRRGSGRPACGSCGGGRTWPSSRRASRRRGPGPAARPRGPGAGPGRPGSRPGVGEPGLPPARWQGRRAHPAQAGLVEAAGHPEHHGDQEPEGRHRRREPDPAGDDPRGPRALLRRLGDELDPLARPQRDPAVDRRDVDEDVLAELGRADEPRTACGGRTRRRHPWPWPIRPP